MEDYKELKINICCKWNDLPGQFTVVTLLWHSQCMLSMGEEIPMAPQFFQGFHHWVCADWETSSRLHCATMKSHSLAWAGCAASQEILTLLINTGDILIPGSIQFGYQDIHFHPLTPEWDIFHESTVLNLSHVVKCSLNSFTPDLLKSWAWISPSLYSTKKILNIYYEKKIFKMGVSDHSFTSFHDLEKISSIF